jgi:hypothetical protein
MTWRERERARGNARNLRAEGFSIREVAEQLGLPPSTVAGWLRGVGKCHRLGTCQLCGEPFVTSSPRRRFCTEAHAQKYRAIFAPPAGAIADPRKTPAFRDRLCELCGQRFTPSNGRQRYCTPAHRDQAYEQGRRPRTITDWQQRVAELEAELAVLRSSREAVAA